MTLTSTGAIAGSQRIVRTRPMTRASAEAIQLAF
jgi:hypothetical protein